MFQCGASFKCYYDKYNSCNVAVRLPVMLSTIIAMLQLCMRTWYSTASFTKKGKTRGHCHFFERWGRSFQRVPTEFLNVAVLQLCDCALFRWVCAKS